MLVDQENLSFRGVVNRAIVMIIIEEEIQKKHNISILRGSIICLTTSTKTSTQNFMK